MTKNDKQITPAISFTRPHLLGLLFVFLLLLPGVPPVMADTMELNQPAPSKTESSPETILSDDKSNDGGELPKEESETPVIDDGTTTEDPVEEPVVAPDNETKTLTTEEIAIQPETQSTNSSNYSFNISDNKDDSETNMTTEINTINIVTTESFTEVTADISITNEKPLYTPSIKLENENEFIESYITIQFLGDHHVLSETQLQSMTMILKIKKNHQVQQYPINRQIYVLSYESGLLSSFSHTFIEEILPQQTSGIWEPLTAVEITQDENYVYYHIETPSYYATFVIVGTELVEIQPYQSGIPEIPWMAIILTVLIASVLLLFVLFKTGCVYQIEDDDDTKNNKIFSKDSNQKWSYKIKLATVPPEIALIQSPRLYFPPTPRSSQVMTASTEMPDSSDEMEEDPMYL